MRQSGLLTCVILAGLVQTPFASAADKKLIEFGWDEPDTQFLRDHIVEMEKAPFDGCVFHAQDTRPNGKRGDFMWECWGKQAFTWEQLRPALEELKATRFQKFTDN